ncbi:MAG TPA: tetratricopeptide repeat protein [Caldimonas sp.]|jgi:tetratricopeptide (TPR) repeat protein|nr:tetratricopeptide repeat protein [Caldimonas sp.]HEX2543095.1 tetratricopeptide repeat protein [Caldimonas sp.]
MRALRLLLAGVGAALLVGCAGAPPSAAKPSLFHDGLFQPPTSRVSTDEVLAVSDAMRHYLKVEIAAQIASRGPQAGLAHAFSQKGQLKLEYDAARTKTAAEAFEARSGNCLSLVVLTAALARELNLSVTFQSAELEATWSRIGGLLFASGHVNITLAPRMAQVGAQRDISLLTIDFLPPDDIRRMRTRVISQATVLAMYANNRAVEALAANAIDDAYAWAGEALRRDPGFIAAYNTLGVVYLRHGNLGEAAQVFEHVLGLEPQHTRALANLAETYSRQGRGAAEAEVRQRLAVLEPLAPFHDFNLGMEAMQRGDYRAARDLFAREVARAGHYHEFHFWLAVASAQLGDLAAARKHLALALENSTTSVQHELYAGKLARLKSAGREQ